jgi:hypothetical protein
MIRQRTKRSQAGRGPKVGAPKTSVSVFREAAELAGQGAHGISNLSRQPVDALPEVNMSDLPEVARVHYVYTIRVSGVVRYIGKGKGLRLCCHMKEVRRRLNRDFKLRSIGSRLQRHLTEAVISGAEVIEQVIVDNLTEKEAYKLEYEHMRECVLAGKRDQLWNVVPPSIRTPAELQEFKERLEKNLTSRDKLIRFFSAWTLKDLIAAQT